MTREQRRKLEEETAEAEIWRAFKGHAWMRVVINRDFQTQLLLSLKLRLSYEGVLRLTRGGYVIGTSVPPSCSLHKI